jgi:beta-glucanase (GH16 family)
MRRITLLIVLAAVVLLGGCAAVAAPQLQADPVIIANLPAAAKGSVVPPAPAGWSTVFSDAFPGKAGTAPSSANWLYDIGTDWGSKNVENDTSSTKNVYVDGYGHLVIQATHTDGKWYSGRIETTRDDFTAPAGGEMEMTASIKQPNGGPGYWPSFWALGSAMRTGGSWPSSGEIDMLESVNSDNESAATLHGTDERGGGSNLEPCPNSPCDSSYNTYSVIINRVNTSAEFAQFLLDGKLVATVTESHTGTAIWQQAVDHGFYMILDLAVGGAYPNLMCHCTTPTAQTVPATLSVGYVAVYEKGGNSTPAAKATTTGYVTASGGDCLTNSAGLNTEYNPIALHSCDGSAGQVWSLYPDQTMRTDGGCLAVGGSNSSGAAVGWYPCTGSANEQWKPGSNGEIVNQKSGLCLTDPHADTTAQIEAESCIGVAQQTWGTKSATAR